MTSQPTAEEFQFAARSMEAHPFLPQMHYPEAFAAVRRHAVELKAMFSKTLGYRLVVDTSFARLMKNPTAAGTPSRPERTTSGAPVNPRVYEHFCLALAALFAPGVGEQPLLSTLVSQVRAEAATSGVIFTDTIAERRDLVTALRIMINWGVLTETDETIAGYVYDEQQEALLTVNRSMLPFMIANNPDRLDDRQDKPARRVLQRLIEDPAVLHASLGEEESRVLRRDKASLSASASLFGLELEARQEGTLLWDDSSEVTDEPFPGVGAVRQVSLLFIAEASAGKRPAPDGWMEVTTADAATIIEQILGDHRGKLRKDFDADGEGAADHVLETVVGFLYRFGFVAVEGETIRLHPALARFRPTVTTIRAPKQTTTEDDKVSLFDGMD